MSDFLKEVAAKIAECEENGGKYLTLTAPKGQSVTMEEMVQMASHLPRALERLGLCDFGNIYGKEISDHLPPSLTFLRIISDKGADPSILHIKLPSTLRSLNIESTAFFKADSLSTFLKQTQSLHIENTAFLKADSLSTWIAQLPGELTHLNIQNCPLSGEGASLLAAHLPPALVRLKVTCQSSKGQKAISTALLQSKNILSFGYANYLDKEALPAIQAAGDVCIKNTAMALDLINKMRSDTLTEKDVGEALQRLPALKYRATEKPSFDDKCLGLEPEEIARMAQNLAKAALKQGIFMPRTALDDGADLPIFQDPSQDRGRVEGIIPKTATVVLPGSTATIASAKAAGTLLQALIAGDLKALCAQTIAKGERFNALDFTTPVSVPGFGDMPLVQVIAEQGELATLCNPANWAGNVRDLSAVLEAVSPELQAENGVNARAVHLKATQLTMQKGRAPGR